MAKVQLQVGGSGQGKQEGKAVDRHMRKLLFT